MNSYETTRSDEFCEFDREMIQNATSSVSQNQIKYMAQKYVIYQIKETFRSL